MSIINTNSIMRYKLCSLLTLLVWLLRPVDSVSSFMTPTDKVQPMESWENTEKTTWTAQTKVNQPINIQQLYTIANAHFNWVKTQKGAETLTGTLLVAALYVPTVQTVFASTISRDPSLKYSLTHAEELSPVWFFRSSNLMQGPRRGAAGLLHAEDSAYFQYESNTKAYLNLAGNEADALKEKYPPGTLLAVWGYYRADSLEKKRTGRPIDLCDDTPREGQRIPSCQGMARSLGVYFELVTDETHDQHDANNNEDFTTDGGDPNACDAAGGPQRRNPASYEEHFKRDISCSSAFLASHIYTFDPTPLTIPLDVATTTSTAESPTTTDQTQHTITSAPTLSCVLHNQDPDQGILKPYCLCDKSITLSPLPATKAQSESCAYTTMPGTSASEVVPTQTQVWTTNCQACTIVGGIADQETCTPVAGCKPTAAPVPTIAAWVGNLSTIEIGDAEDGNNGTDLAKEMFSKLRANCNSTSCTGDQALMDNVETILGGGEEPLKPAMRFQIATFSSPAVLDQMLAVGISTWIAALNNPTLGLCKEVEYEADEDPTGVGCGKSPIAPSRLRKKTRRDTGAVIWKRNDVDSNETAALEERCLGDCAKPKVCHYTSRTCSSPDEISVVMAEPGNPYANHLNIGVKLDNLAGEGFLCEMITEALTFVVLFLAPELLAPDAMADVDLQAMCGIFKDPASIIGSLTETVRVLPHDQPGTPKLLAGVAT